MEQPPTLKLRRAREVRVVISWILRPFTNVFADTFDGNAFASIKFGGCSIEALRDRDALRAQAITEQHILGAIRYLE